MFDFLNILSAEMLTKQLFKKGNETETNSIDIMV